MADGALETIAAVPESPAKPPGKATKPDEAGRPGKVAKKAGGHSKFVASVWPPTPLPEKFVNAVRQFESAVNGPVWLVIQDAINPNEQVPFSRLDETFITGVLAKRASIPKQPLNVIIESAGGQAKTAYQLANLLRVHCGGFDAFVAEWAKSAATLFVLGASNIYLADFAELGPLDVQIFDPEREGMASALDEVQALERLNAFALQAVDAGMLLLTSRSGKSLGTLLPEVLHFVAEMLRPMFEKLDTVHYTQMSRLLKVGEAYAVRLLEGRYGKQRAEEIARQLVNEYPEHGFYIDRHEANRMGLKVLPPKDDVASALEEVRSAMHGIVAVGQVIESNA